MILDNIFKNVDYKVVSSFDIKKNGIQVIESVDKIEIYNDVFRTIPLFITKDDDGKIIIFSNFEDFCNLGEVDKTIDEVGFWEIVLFEGGLYTRTLYKNVKQMPSAAKIIINKNTKDYKIERYWDFNIEEDKSIDSLEKAAKGLYEKLDSIFSKLDRKQKYVMGLSGGMDSRITLAFLSKYIPKENLELFTYGFDERILEYKYACGVAEALGYNKPKFHKLTKKSYQDAMSYLPRMSGGQIGVNHCHIISFLKDNNLEGYKQISNYFSDALFGYDCSKPKKIDNIENNYYAKCVSEKDYLSKNIKEIIIEDSKKIFNKFNDKSNFSSLSEYRYLTERNQKFHSYLAYIQDADLVLANFDLMVYMVSVSIEYREQKKLLDIILDKYFPEVSGRQFENISSRDFNGVKRGFTLHNKFLGVSRWYYFKFLNHSNAILRLLTKGQIQLFNKYQTEEQERLLYRDFQKELRSATIRLMQVGLFSKDQKDFFDKMPIRSSGTNERYVILTLSKLI